MDREAWRGVARSRTPTERWTELNLVKRAVIAGRAWVTVENTSARQPQCALCSCAVQRQTSILLGPKQRSRKVTHASRSRHGCWNGCSWWELQRRGQNAWPVFPSLPLLPCERFRASVSEGQHSRLGREWLIHRITKPNSKAPLKGLGKTNPSCKNSEHGLSLSGVKSTKERKESVWEDGLSWISTRPGLCVWHASVKTTESR